MDICSIETVFALLQTDSLRTRVLFVKILDLILRNPILATNFEAMRGFQLLGQTLNAFTVSGTLSLCTLNLKRGVVRSTILHAVGKTRYYLVI